MDDRRRTVGPTRPGPKSKAARSGRGSKARAGAKVISKKATKKATVARKPVAKAKAKSKSKAKARVPAKAKKSRALPRKKVAKPSASGRSGAARKSVRAKSPTRAKTRSVKKAPKRPAASAARKRVAARPKTPSRPTGPRLTAKPPAIRLTEEHEPSIDLGADEQSRDLLLDELEGETAVIPETTLPSKSARPPVDKAEKDKSDKNKSAALRFTDSAFRLSPDVRPIDYRIHILPDLPQAKFRGEEIIDIDLKRAVPSIELHAADIAIEHAEVSYPGVPEPPPAPWGRAGQPPAGTGPISLPQTAVAIVPHASRETVEIKFLRPLAAGHVKLGLAFRGPLQDRLRGLYKASSGGRRYAFTQLEAADARRFFPCFDEPEYKARFTFSVTTDTNVAVISNSPLERVDRNAYGTATRHFRPTPKLSTYLCALAVGELESSPERRIGKVPVRVWCVPGKASLTAFALDCAVESLRRLEAYFDLPYPYEKLDLVAVPDFEAGAMENAGAVFFRETLLLVDPATITVAEKKRAAEVIAHELAHMWFGNLVTMRWWDDLWLNEAFATWMAFKIVDEWKPDWRMWNNFEPHRAAALALDALANTHPIYAEVANAAQATENFDAITYEKGASVVRMLEHYLGAQKFRAGVRTYIRRHRESNAVAADLWRALEKASGQPVGQVARSWIKQAGFPLVSLSLEQTAGAPALSVRQERFLASPATRVPGADSSAWPVPMVVKLSGRGDAPPRLERALVRAGRGRIPLPGGKAPEWFYGNAAEGGFYRVRHDDACLAAIGANLFTALTPVERMGLVGHQWAIVRAGRANLRSFLDLAGRLGKETDHEVLDTVSAYLAFLDDQLADTIGPEGRPGFQNWLRGVFRPAWMELGWDPASSHEQEERRLRRASVLRILGQIGEDPEIAAEATERLRRYLEVRSTLEPNLAEPLIAIVARDGEIARFERFRAAVGEARTPQERRRFQLALGDFRAPEAIERALALTLTPEIPTQDVAFLLIRLLGNRVARNDTWTFMQREWDRLGKRLPPMMASRLIEATAALQTRDHRREVATFFRAHPVETGARALRLALERFDVNEEFRRRASKDLRSWLGIKPSERPVEPGPATGSPTAA